MFFLLPVRRFEHETKENIEHSAHCSLVSKVVEYLATNGSIVLPKEKLLWPEDSENKFLSSSQKRLGHLEGNEIDALKQSKSKTLFRHDIFF